MPTVRTILPQNTNEVPILRVAAYCRVSTDSEDQQHSLGAQTEYYTKLIGENPHWTLADTLKQRVSQKKTESKMTGAMKARLEEAVRPLPNYGRKPSHIRMISCAR